MSKVSINESTLTAIGNAIREKTGKTALIAPGSMPTEIRGIQTGGGGGELPEEALIITGNCDYRFANNGWNWFVETYGNRITTKDITNLEHMFYYTKLECQDIPFAIRGKSNTKLHAKNTFAHCNSETIRLADISFASMQSTFSYCSKLKNLYFENCNWTTMQTGSGTAYSGNDLFNNCNSLRHIPEDFLKQIYNLKVTSKYYVLFQNGFYQCYGLDEIRGISPRTGTLTSNVFTNTFNDCARVLNIVFDTQEDGTPYIANWKNQIIDLSGYIGHVSSSKDKNTWILLTNAGITADKEVIDNATYQALKNDPDWFTCDVNYSRYNHDSAVETINSLPDCSASGGANTIKFKGAAGELTDGGAINTLTEAEIAVAAAKGWTVTLV